MLASGRTDFQGEQKTALSKTASVSSLLTGISSGAFEIWHIKYWR